MAFPVPLNNQLGGQQSPGPLDGVSPHQLLDGSAALSNEWLMHNIPRSQSQMNAVAGLQQNNPQFLHQQMLLHNPYMAKPQTLPKRGVNSWMAFRSFYSRIFAKFQQKNTSTYIKAMWDNDPFKAKWTIVARAYTTIRDYVGKSNASIDLFLDIVCPKIGIIGVEAYFTMMNWSVESTEDNTVVFRQIAEPDLSTFPQSIMTTLMTERDVIHFCASRAYIPQSVAVIITGPPTNAAGATTFPGSQQGLMATTPTMPSTARSPLPAFVQQTVQDPVAMATSLFGFDVGVMLDESMGYQWTNNMSDLYHLDGGAFDFDDMLRQTDDNAWNAFDVTDPRALDYLLEDGGLRDGFLTPNL
ncbi:alpha-1 domain protein [Halenospora varia]|nr:alpha-1 domain protein [Halenospora varia]